ncbi:MAG TPA: SRPBCC family protein [Streptosporangiaceae bacterium]|nr:SRPBCC family protein [Streptosporangiaceae bacterium]
MKLDNEFTVGVPIEQAWAVLTDLELIAPCMPGAQLTGVTDDGYTGKVKIKVGPVTAEYAGTAQFSVKDETSYRAVIDARGRDSRGNGNATAVISAQLQPAGGSTQVSVSTDLTIAGRIAQFGSGMIKEVSAKLLGQFVTCLEGKLSSGAVSQAAPVGAGGGGAAGNEATTSGPASAASTASTPSAAGTTSDGGQGTGQAAGTVTAPATSVTGQAAATVPSAAATGPGAAVTGVPAPTSQAGAASMAASGPEPAALNLMSVASQAILKRLVPLVIGLIVVAAIIYLIAR